ncbi:MAG TPA: hypothetical protein VK914_06810 [bacterium]|jgi:hypothetical protein|nr:hypothetical protein [bacterium]
MTEARAPDAAARTNPWWLWGLVQGVCLALAFYRGFRAPSLWSLNYYQLSWADGFLRRGLLGTLLLPLGCARFDPHVIWMIQCAVLAAASAVLFSLGRRGTAVALALCVFWASRLGTQFFNEVGYPDQVLILLAVACGALLSRGRVWATALVLAAAALIHEMAAFTVLPLVLALRSRLPLGKRPALWKLLTPPALALAALPYFATSVPVATLLRYSGHALACGHPLGRPDFLSYYRDSLGQALHCYYLGPEWFGMLLPLAASLALWILLGGAFPGALMGERCAALLACLCPLLLGFLGADRNRWLLLALLQVVLLLGLSPSASPSDPGPAPSRPGAWRRATLALPLLIFVLTLRFALFDGFEARPLDLDAIRGFGADLAGQWDRPPLR